MLNNAHGQQLALDAARESVVLLQNRKLLLPLRASALAGKTVAVMGPMANDSAVLMGGKSDYCPQHSVSLFEGMSAAGQQVRASDTFSFMALAVSIT